MQFFDMAIIHAQIIFKIDLYVAELSFERLLEFEAWMLVLSDQD